MTTTDVKLIIPISPCPWCKETPEFILYFDSWDHKIPSSNNTWIPKIACKNQNCTVQPESKPVPIRRTSKTDFERLKEKIIQVFDNWNIGNPVKATHGKEIDFDKILEEGKKDEKRRKNN
jgi:hypothetical protein